MKIHSLLLLTIFSFLQVHAEVKFTPLFVSDPSIPGHFSVSYVACINVDNFDSDNDPEIIFGESDYLYGTKIHLIDKKSDGQYIDIIIGDSVKVGVGDNLVISDMNGDGYKDIIVRSTILLNNGDMTFKKQSLQFKGASDAMSTVFDVDGDGDMDIVATVWQDLYVLLKNDGKANFTESTIFDHVNLVTPSIIDWDNDGDLDIFCYERNPSTSDYHGTLCVLLNNGDGVFFRKYLLNVPYPIKSSPGYIPIDFDSDGDLDIVLEDSTSLGVLNLYEHDGDILKKLPNTSKMLNGIFGNWTSADFDNDGLVDIYPSRDCWIKNTIRSFIPQDFIKNGNGDYAIPFDYDGDGDIDLLGMNPVSNFPQTNGFIIWYLNDLAPEINFPVDGNPVVAQSQDTIRWRSSYEGTFSINYSVDGGRSWVLVGNTSSKKDSTIIWNVPSTLSDSCLIRITDIETGKLKGISKKCFSIVRGTLSITAPANSDLFTIGDSCDISWVNKGTTGPVDLFYSDTINKTNWHTIGTTLPEFGHYNWKLTSDLPAAVNLMIRSSTYQDIVSKKPVRIYIKKAPFITVLNPKSGSSIYNKRSLTIQWTATSSITLLKIQISVDSGNTWEMLADNLQNTGTLAKMIDFDYPYPDCFIKISDKANPLCFDMNDSSFPIINSSQANGLQDQNKSRNTIHLKIGKMDCSFDVNGTNHNLVSLELFSLNGKKVFSLPPTVYSVDMQSIQLFINKIPKDTYLLKILVNKKALFKKFTIVDN